MIFTDRTITVKKGASSIDEPIVLYRGDKEVEIRFTLNESFPFKFGSGANSNIIEKTEAAYGQLVIKTPNDLPSIFSKIAPTNEGKIVFTITAEMINEITEVGNYTFQIRLFDESRNSRATIPEVVNGIEIREPIATEDISTTNEVEIATVGYALTTAGVSEDAFDAEGNYNKTTWGTGDRITAAKLNKMEAGIDGVNNKIANLDLSGVDLTGYAKTEDIPTRVSQLTNDSNYVNTTQMNEAIANVTGQTVVEPEELDMPKVFFYGTALPTSKTNVNLTMDYISNTAKFSSFVKLKCQGNSSMSYAKKNFTVSMFSDEARATKLKKDFKGWGAQSKFCLKANYIDTTHTRNLSGARIAYDMVASRPDSEFKQQLLQCPRNGVVDGFPIKLYFNGEFYGIYTWNIPKDTWMFNMDKNNPNHCVLCAEKNTDGNANLINSCQFRQLWTNGDGNDWSVEVGIYNTDMVASFNRCINFVMTATDQEFHDNIGDYFDLYSLLDYYCFSYLCCHLDGLAKNMLMVTYDGVHWGASLYDMDSIFGVNWTGGAYVATNYQCPEQYQERFSALWSRIEKCFATELYARYLELRQGALSLSNIVKHVEEIYDVIPDRVFADEKAKWTSLPNVNNNTMTRFRNYMRDRAVYVDAQMLEIGTPVVEIPCTSISLDRNTLTFDLSSPGGTSEVITPTSEPGFLVRNAYGYNYGNGNPLGAVIVSNTDNTVDFIDVTGVESITVTRTNTTRGIGVIAYDSNKTGVYALNNNNGVLTWKTKEASSDDATTFNFQTTVITDFPEDVKYIRFCVYGPLDGVTITKTTAGVSNTQTLVATVEPSNCTEAIVWLSNATKVATVNNGLITAKGNGECTITATCGTQIATCNVTVSGMSESGGDTPGGGDTGDYTDISYIESTGTQYINTGIVPTASTKIELVAEMSPSKQYDHIFGSDNFMKVQWSDDTGTAIFATKKSGQNQISELTLGKHTYVMDMAEIPNVITIDGTKYGNIIGHVESTTNSLLLLSGYKADGTVETDLCGIGKIYSCKIYYEDTLVANMKPILTNSGTYGLLDTVNNSFYASEVGSFTGGDTPSGGDEVRNAWESATWTEQYYNDDGNLTSYDAIHHSSLIPVNGNEIITVECDASVNSPYLRLSYFNSDSQYIGYDRGLGYNTAPLTSSNSITVDLTNGLVNIAYVSINANTSNKSLLTVYSYSIIDVSTSYVNGNISRNSNAVTNGTAGTVTENSVDITSDYIDCSNGIKISVSDTTHVIGAVAYNENKEYLATYDGRNKIWRSEGYDDSTRYSNLLITTFPNTAKYIRFTVGQCTNSSLVTVKTLQKM